MTEPGGQAATAAPPRPPRVFALGALGAALLWLSQPPIAWWPLAWVAPAAWLLLADLPGRFGAREYLKVWLAGSLYWLLAVHWVCLPHPLTPLGWLPLAMYLGCYPLAMVATVRAARRRWDAPLWLAGPVAWTGLELVQARLFSGFLMGAVSHSQAHQPWVRSIAAYVGAYGVTFAVVLVAATIAASLRSERRARSLIGVAIAAGFVGFVGAAGRDASRVEEATGPRPTVALVQGDTRATWDPDPQRGQKIMDRQVALSGQAVEQARAAGRRLDLVIWPESMFRSPWYTFEGSITPPANDFGTDYPAVKQTNDWFRSLAALLDASLLVGIDRYDWRADPANETTGRTARAFNSVALADRTGRIVGGYDKTHLVPFGEYIPLAEGMPALYYLTPMSGGLNAGEGPVALRAPLREGEELTICPSICYETVVPHLPRSHVAELAARGERPDVLVNVTNDAWFWGSAELDMHLACGVFRAVETGTPLLVAANGGLSAVIDAGGEVREVGPRMAEHVLVAAIPPAVEGLTPYTAGGDWFAGSCLLLTVLAPLGVLLRHVRRVVLRRS